MKKSKIKCLFGHHEWGDTQRIPKEKYGGIRVICEYRLCLICGQQKDVGFGTAIFKT